MLKVSCAVTNSRPQSRCVRSCQIRSKMKRWHRLFSLIAKSMLKVSCAITISRPQSLCVRSNQIRSQRKRWNRLFSLCRLKGVTLNSSELWYQNSFPLIFGMNFFFWIVYYLFPVILYQLVLIAFETYRRLNWGAWSRIFDYHVPPDYIKRI